MQVLFLTLVDFYTFDERSIYSDLLREFIKNGHEVYCISPAERRTGVKTHFEEDGHILKLRIGNIQKTNIVEKSFSTLMIERLFISAIKKYYANITFDLILYSTPPITFERAVRYVKKRDRARTYLMLKDIFPQNAVDLEMMSPEGIKGLIYRYFRKKEKNLYLISDQIGCMSQANIEYVLQNNTEIPRDKVGLCPNCIEVFDKRIVPNERIAMRARYGLPQDKTVFIYGGNLGRPQNVRYIVDCLRKCSSLNTAHFLVVGDGTDRWILEEYFEIENPTHATLLKHLPKSEYDSLVACCDVGLIFLDYRFTIPNFPSRLLSYMQAGLPVFACTDMHTDIGKVITEGEFGWWCASNNVDSFYDMIKQISNTSLSKYGDRSWQYLCDEYNVQKQFLDVFGAE